MRKLLDLMEATATPRQGVTGQKLAQTSGGQFMNRADRTNQTKVNAALGGAINPATGKPYVAGKADTNLALAKKFSQPATVAAAPPAATNVAAPSADNEALKGRTIAKAMNPTPVASNPATASADTRGAAAMASRSAPAAPDPATATSTVPASQALDPGEEIVSSPTNTQTAPYNGAAANAMASRSAPAAPEPATAATDAPIATSSTMSPMDREEEIQRNQGLPYVPPAPKATDTKIAQTAPTQTSDQIATAALNAPATDVSGTSKNIPAAYGQMAEEEIDENNMNPAPAQTPPVNKTNQSKLPSMYDVDKANRKEIASQFDPKSTYVNPYDKDTKASAPGSKAVNTMADFEEDVDHALAEMMRLSGLALNEKAPPGAKAERTVKHIKKGYAKDGKLTKKEKGIAYATAWKQHNKEKVNEGMDIMLDEDGHTLKHIVNRFKHETKNFMNSGFMAENLFDALFDYYLDRGDMPYGIAKAREGDPYQWVEERFYADMGSEMSEGAVAEQTVDPLSELARLAGLSEDGPGQFGMPGTTSTSTKDKTQSTGNNKSVEPMAQFAADLGMPELPGKAFSDKERQDYRKIMQDKKAAQGKSGVDEDGPGASRLYTRDKSGMGVVPSADSRKDPGIMMTPSADSRKDPGIVMIPKERSLKDRMSANEGISDVTDTVIDKAKGLANKGIDAFNDYEQRKKDAWDSRPFGGTPGPGHSGYIPSRLPRFQTKADTELADKDKAPSTISTPAATKADAFGHALGAASGSKNAKADDKLKENDELNRVRRIAGLQECGDMSMGHERMHQKDRLNVTTNMSSDGTKDVTINAQGNKADELLQMLKMAGMRAHDDHDHSSMSEPEVIMISSDDEEMMEADRVTDYSNTPEEEYQTVDSIIRQGNDLNREKRQYKKEYPGDNPMSESLIDADLDAMLESILLRDDTDSQNPIQLTPKSYDPKTGADWSGYNITSPKTGRIGARIEPGKDIEYYAADPLPPDDVTGATIKNHGKDVEWHRGSEVDEGWEDVSNFIGDLVGTEASKLRGSQQLRDLDAMRKQYKGTEYEKQVNDRYTTHLDRLQGDKGEVVGKDGEPIKVLPPQQWKGGK